MKNIVVREPGEEIGLENNEVPFVEDKIGDSIGDFVVPTSVLDDDLDWEYYGSTFISSPNAPYYYVESDYLMVDDVEGTVEANDRLAIRVDRELAVFAWICSGARVRSGMKFDAPQFDVQELDCEVVVEDGSFVVGDGSDVTVNPLDVEYFAGNRWHDVVVRFDDRLYCDDEGDLWVGNGVYGIPFQPSANIMRFRDLPGQKLFFADSVV